MVFRRRRFVPMRSRRFVRSKRKFSRRAAPYRKRFVKRRSKIPHLTENRKIVRLDYIECDNPTLTIPGANSFVYRAYNLNGAYRPTGTSGTSIPGFLEWGNFYNRYRVFASRLECEFIAELESAPMICGIHFQPDASVTNLNTWAAWRKTEGNPYTKTGVLTVEGSVGTLKLAVKSYLPSIFGAGPMYRTDYAYQGFTGGANSTDTAANPSRILNGYVWIQTCDNSNVGANTIMAIKLKLSMWVEFFDRLDMFS